MWKLFKQSWPTIILGSLLVYIAITNFHPGKIILGNDNFSPELNPGLTVERSFLNPSWRDNRVLGIPSDSEQADVWRASIFWVSNLVFPAWATSQLYIFFTLVIGVFSMGQVTKLLLKGHKTAEFFGALLYLFSPITIWVYFNPVHLFVAAYAFTPLIIWRIFEVVLNPSRANKFLLLISSLLMGTAALTATMFITCSATIVAITLSISSLSKKFFRNSIVAVAIYLLPQLFWALPFTTYVISNNQALQDSSINREITSSTIESENTTNTALNTLRFSGAWMDSKENDRDYTYPNRSWFKENKTALYLMLIPTLLTILGLISSLFNLKKELDFIFIGITGVLGWILLKGSNPPFNNLYDFFDKNIPLFHQVFRWSSSKFWPILLIPMVILSVKGIEIIILSLKRYKFIRLLSISIATILLIIASHPIITSPLIRNDIFVEPPSNYAEIASNIPEKNALIDTIPHTNTRYFKKTDWGFWGSVFLNYLIKNPTTEKALVIGSYENESAFYTLDESFYSGNPTTYLNSLARYHIPYVLSDRSATNNGLGKSYSYPYDWNSIDSLINKSSDLKQVSSKGFLTLYENNQKLSDAVFSVSSNHNYEVLNKILSVENQNNPYYLKEGYGEIHPFGLQPKNISTKENYLSLSFPSYSNGSYNLNIAEEEFLHLPLLATLKNDELIISPYYPILKINNESLITAPESRVSVTSPGVTIGDQVITSKPTLINRPDISQIRKWTGIIRTNLTSSVLPTPCSSKQTTRANESCLSSSIDIEKPGLVSLTTEISSESPTLVDICLHSKLENKCLNSPQTFEIKSETKTIAITAQKVAKKGDNLLIFYVTKTNNDSSPKVSINNLEISQLANSHMLSLPAPKTEGLNQNLDLKSTDILSLNIPILPEMSSYQVFRSECPDRGPLNSTEISDSSTTFTTTNCFDGVYFNLTLPEQLQSKALLTFVKSNNVSGIPLEYNLKQNGLERKITTDILPAKHDQIYTKFTLLPETNQNFTLELVNKGIGKNPSINTIEDLGIIPIPPSWISLKLTPAADQKNIALKTLDPYIKNRNTGTYISHVIDTQGIYTIRTATSPYWKAVVTTRKPKNIISLYLQTLIGKDIKSSTVINGWEQGWEIDSTKNGQYLCVIFLPNVLAYLGLFLGIVLSGAIIARSVSKRLND